MDYGEINKNSFSILEI